MQSVFRSLQISITYNVRISWRFQKNFISVLVTNILTHTVAMLQASKNQTHVYLDKFNHKVYFDPIMYHSVGNDHGSCT